MREIKFRAWDMALARMRGVDSVRWGFDGKIIKVGFTDGSYKSRHYDSIDDVVFMQFTGLKDMNGKEIYEGDLVVCYLDGTKIGVVDTVLYNDESAAFEFKRRYTTIKAFLEHDGMFDTEIEVIGNIYENKELENA